ncbi:MAG TPA: diacylglycerol kinase family protein [Pseudonocardiaceae bacterium]|nr:diacylglycerol kinase family protein [Pseudonocardiaceae bacterium]
MTDSALLAVAVLGAVAAVLLIAHRRTRRSGRPQPAPLPESPHQRLPAVVVNPSRFDDVVPVCVEITRVCAELGWAEPLWLETSVEDPGMGQAKAALAAGADVVLVCGGDGTIRNVAQVLAGSGTAVGLLPAGTGNLLARNLALHLEGIEAATRIALSGQNRALDVGRVRIDDGAEEQVFLVMAGMGFDAEIMAGAPTQWKDRVGPLAYFVSGIRALSGPRVRISVAMDGQPALRRRVRTVVVGNCGKLLAGLVLMPAAKVDDGLLDVVAIAPKGIIGWLAVAARVITRRRSGHPIVEHWQGTEVTITAEGPQQAQLDGDPVGEARVLRMRVEQGALLVRVAS